MAAGIEREKISAVDTAWLRMDSPQNRMIICGVLTFRERLDFARLKAIVTGRFLRHSRFRQRAVDADGEAYWEPDPHFDIDRHVVRAALPGRAGNRALRAYVSRLASAPFDPAHPAWQFQLVDNFEGGSALLLRIHHSYADGVALVQVLQSMTDTQRAGPPVRSSDAPGHSPPPAAADDLLAGWLQPVSGNREMAIKVGRALLAKGAALWSDPGRRAEFAGQGQALAGEIAKLVLMRQDSPTRFKGAPGIRKRVAWAAPLSLEEVRTVGRALGASVNDVLLSCVAGALAAYLRAKGDAVEGVTIRAMVPVNLRPAQAAEQLGNRFGVVFLDLPIGIANPVERLYAVRGNMSALKESYQPVLSLGILAALGVGPRLLQQKVLALLARNATAVMTNVPGPQQPLYLAGARIDGLIFWVPQSSDIGIGVSIMSYHGAVQFGLITDRGLCPDPERIVERFAGEFEQLVLTTLMAPWPRRGDLSPRVAAAAVGAAGRQR